MPQESSSERMDHHPQTVFELFNEIGIIDQLATTRFERALPYGLTASQFSVLNNFVRLGGERSPKQLADAFQVTKGAMTNTLSKLESKGFVTIRPSDIDGRAKIVQITQAGVSARHEAIAQAAEAMSDLAGLITPEMLSTLLGPLRTIRAYLDRNR